MEFIYFRIMEETVTDEVRTQKRGVALEIAIHREERRNALNERVANGLVAALDQAEADPEIRAVILTGAGTKAFCAGVISSRLLMGHPSRSMLRIRATMSRGCCAAWMPAACRWWRG